MQHRAESAAAPAPAATAATAPKDDAAVPAVAKKKDEDEAAVFDSSDDERKQNKDVCDQDDSDEDSDYKSEDSDGEGDKSLHPFVGRNSPFGAKYKLDADVKVIPYSDLYAHFRPRGVIRVNRWACVSSKLCALHDYVVHMRVARGSHVVRELHTIHNSQFTCEPHTSHM